MKKIKFLFAFLFAAALSSCIDIEESIIINDDNSGSYSITMDMGKLFELKNQMGGDNNSSKKPKEKKDTLIELKNVLFSSDLVTAQEKELYQNATINIKMDEAEGEMKMVMLCPFKSLSNLPEIKKNFFKVLDKLKVMDNLSGKEKEKNEERPDVSATMLTPGADNHQEFSASIGTIENKIVNPKAYKEALASDSSMQMMQQMASMMGEMTYSTKITTPKEIISFTGNEAMLSANKKTIIFKVTFTELLETPEKQGYKITY
jgi:hypothetical protein